MSPIIDKNTGRAVALVVVSSDGRQLLATVDAQRPSRLLLKDREGRVYALQVGVSSLWGWGCGVRGGGMGGCASRGWFVCGRLWERRAAAGAAGGGQLSCRASLRAMRFQR